MGKAAREPLRKGMSITMEKEHIMKRTRIIILVVATALGVLLIGSSGSIGGLGNAFDPYSAWPEAQRQPGINPFVGKWVNIDSTTPSFTRMAISIEWGQMIVDAWASCSPEDCEWPRVIAQIPRGESKRIEATWVLPIVNEFQDIILTEDDHLIVHGKSFYTYDDSGRCGQYTLEFVRGDFSLPQ
jgi:hypothetical protein